MILPDYMIRERWVNSPKGGMQRMVEPFAERAFHETGLTFGLSHAGYDVRIKQNLTLAQGDFKIASTLEHFVIPDDVMAFVLDKSTMARQGISLFNTCLEPSWHGYLTLELVCHAPGPVTLKAGQPIAQIVFHQMMAPPQKGYDGRYQGQHDAPVPARFGTVS
jgi:dCTP deaminase